MGERTNGRTLAPHIEKQTPFCYAQLVPLTQMRSGTYVDFRQGPLTLVNLVVVGD